MAVRWSVLAGWVIAMMGVSGFSGSIGASAQVAQGGQYIYALIVLGIAVLAGVGIWWWLVTPSRPEEVSPRASRVAVPDDLTRIEGIGPKISGLLREAGISTFADLAEASVDRLQELVADAGLTALADPETWAEQARLAAEGQWERLEALQDELKGGGRE